MKAQASLKAQSLSIALTLLGPLMAWSGPASPQVNAATTITQMSASLKTKTLPVQKIMGNRVTSKTPKTLDAKAFLLDQRKVLNSGGGMDSGGGHIIEPNKITGAQLNEAVTKSKFIIRLFFNDLENYKLNNDGEELNKACHDAYCRASNKILQTPDAFRTKLENLKVEIRKNQPCLGKSGEVKDASIYASTKGAICLSGSLLKQKLDEFFYEEQLAGLILHEISHFFGTDELEAESLQKELISRLKGVSIEQLIRTGYEKVGPAVSTGLYGASYRLSTNDISSISNRCAVTRNALGFIEMGEKEILYSGNFFGYLSYRQLGEWVTAVKKLEKLKEFYCSTEPTESDAYRQQNAKNYLEFFGNNSCKQLTNLETQTYSHYQLGQVCKITSPEILESEIHDLEKIANELHKIYFNFGNHDGFPIVVK